jgi:glutathione S-transferase
MQRELIHLAIGNKLYSSWSMRPWVLMRALGIPFTETVIPMYRDDTKAAMLKFAPTGMVPAINHGDVVVWESLSLMEYIAEAFPDKNIWPRDAVARAHARSAASEMHAGFRALRMACPVNLSRIFKPKDYAADVHADIARIEAMWADCRNRFGSKAKGDATGPFLYGAYCAADAMYTPVVTRLEHYQIPVKPETRAYMDAILNHHAFKAWNEEALREPWYLAHYEAGHTVERVLAHPQAGQTLG